MTVIEKENQLVRLISYKKRKQEIVADTWCAIDEDYSLIRYLCEEMKYRDINFNVDGYIVIKRSNNTITTIHRFILEYYAKSNDKLKWILNNGEYEVNHINKEKLDNRLVNLELVTKLGNRLHRDNKPYYDEIIMTSLELQAIQKSVIENSQQNIDRNFLGRASGKFNKGIRENIVYEEIIKCRYLEFNYVKFYHAKHNIIQSQISDCSDLGGLAPRQKALPKNRTKSMSETIKKYTKNYTKKYIEKLLNEYENNIFKNKINANIKTLNRYQSRHSDLDIILSTFKLNKRKRKKVLTLKSFKKKMIYKFKDKKSNSKTLLIDLFDVLRAKKYYSIYDDNILATVNVEKNFTTRGKYTAFRVAFLLGLLDRQIVSGNKREVRLNKNGFNLNKHKESKRKRVHSPIAFSIPVYTQDLLKEADNRAKILLKLGLRKINYFTVREAFGEIIANKVFKNPKCKINYERYGLTTKADVMNFLSINSIIKSRGYMKPVKIVEHLELINDHRKNRKEQYCKIFGGLQNFVTGLLNYNTDVKAQMQKLRYLLHSIKWKDH